MVEICQGDMQMQSLQVKAICKGDYKIKGVFLRRINGEDKVSSEYRLSSMLSPSKLTPPLDPRTKMTWTC